MLSSIRHHDGRNKPLLYFSSVLQRQLTGLRWGRWLEMEDTAFTSAVATFINENKPDELCRRQMEGWTFEWKPDQSPTPHSPNNDTNHSSSPWWWSKHSPSVKNQNRDNDEEHNQVLAGVLAWKGPYMIVNLETICCWKHYTAGQGNEGDVNQGKSGSLYFACRAWGEFTSFQPTLNGHETIHDASQAKEAVIHDKMVKRLKQNVGLTNFTNRSKPHEVCEASIIVSTSSEDLCRTASSIPTDRLEERVHWNESTVETIQHAIFSQAESTLEVLELILSFPFLPTSSTTQNNVSLDVGRTVDSLSGTSYYLARRAKLRLLEDAMFDACEKEEDDDDNDGIVEELHVTKKAKT